MLALGRPTIPEKGVARVTRNILKFHTPLNFSGMAEDGIVKFYAQLDPRTVNQSIEHLCGILHDFD